MDDLRSERTLRIAVIDDLLINRLGTAEVLRAVPDVSVLPEWVMDFSDALVVKDWSSVDLVVLDIALETDPEDQTPSVGVARHIRTSSPGPSPFILGVTSHPRAYEAVLIHKRLMAADPRMGLVWRKDLEKRVIEAARCSTASGLFEVPLLADRKVTRADLEEMDRMGIAPRTDIEQTFQEARRITRMNGGERALWRARVEAAVRARVIPRTKEGNVPHNADIPTKKHWTRLYKLFQVDQ